jgi:hypothetical protein
VHFKGNENMSQRSSFTDFRRTSQQPIPPLSRRDLLKRAGMGIGSLALGNLLHGQGFSADSAASVGATPLGAKQPHYPPRVKSIIWLMMNGGPSQVDTWDYKPELQRRDGQQLADADPKTGFFTTSGKLLKSPFQFAQHGESGTWVSGIFPNLARQVDDLAFVHSCHTEANNHSPALFQLNTGLTRMGFPCVGSWITYGLGTESQDLPAFVVMTDALGRGLPKGHAQNWGAGFLPGSYQGVRLRNNGPPVDNLDRSPGQSPSAQRAMLDRLAAMNRQHLERYSDESELSARIESFELAFRMQLTAPDILNADHEPGHIQRLYGLDNDKCAHFGRQCLIARRLVENGVRFIQIYSGGTDNEKSWDGHLDIRANHSNFALEVDQPIAALLSDLKSRGLLDSTLVICGGEFGRTSDSQGSSGRDHNPNAFTTWFAGGGIRGGVHYGATDEFGYKAVDRRVTVHDLHATILHLLGMNHEQLTYRFNGRDYRLTDVYGNVLEDILS